jgi:hypothetical protein
VAALAVVEDLEVVEDGEPMALWSALPVQQFGLQAGQEALGHGVVQGAADCAHRTEHFGPVQVLPEAQCGVLRSLGGMMKDAVAGIPVRQGHL